MTQIHLICPYLGLAGDRTVVRSAPDSNHRCYAQEPPGSPTPEHQARFCLTRSHEECPHFVPAAAGETPAPMRAEVRRGRRARRDWPRWLLWGLLAVLTVAVVAVFARDLLRPPAIEVGPTPASIRPTVAPSPTRSPTDTPAPVAAARAQAVPATPPPGGSVLTLRPAAGAAGWWTNAEARGNHLGDSFLYAGYWEGRAFVSAAVFELGQAPAGAPVREATLRLTGLSADRFEPAAGGVWSVDLLAADALPDIAQADFQGIFTAPAAVSLFPTLFPADLAPGQVNVLALDAGAREWLAAQVATGAGAVIARISGPGGGDTLFAWDSGAGPATSGEGPELTLVLGPEPAVPPTAPPESVLVATLTPTPANILTVAAEAWTATAAAARFGAATSLPWRIVTPTPSPANLATLQANALLLGMAPIVPHTPTPANPATAAAQSQWATAVAFLTGTPTATPRGAVTPAVLTPTPRPENVLTAAARLWTATAEAQARGTPTPWPYNAIVATVTPPWIVVTDTPQPANAATATRQAEYATAVALVIGTFTPLPPNAATPTPPGGPAASPAPPPTPAAEQPAGAGVDCPDPRVQIRRPLPGPVGAGRVTIAGTATGEAFAYYVIDIAAGELATANYIEIGRHGAAIGDGVLGWLEFGATPAGVYTLRLTVFNRDGSALPACRITLTAPGP